jgi:Ni/Co efflux regulator RcnB
MRKFRTIMLSLLLVPGMAFGQQQPGSDGRPGPGQQAGTNRPAPGVQRPAPGADRPGSGANRPTPGASRPDRGPMPGRPGGDGNRPGQGGNRPTPLPSPVPNRPGRPDHGTRPPYRPGQPGGPNRPGQPNRPGRPGYHRPGEGRPPSFRPIRGPVFRYPHGYRYRRWSIGLLLPQLFLTSNYIYNQWSTLGVEPPPPGYYWVRYGPDLLLVQRGTRRIADVIYGAFL